jgi:glutamate synthase (NADPH/NADH) large chain
LRERFSGKPEFVVNFFEYIAEEVREYLAALGYRTLQEALGHVEMIDAREALDHWKAKGLDISPMLEIPQNPYDQTLTSSVGQDHGLDEALDVKLIELSRDAIADARPVSIDLPIRNVNRTVGTMLGYEVTKAWGGKGLPEGTINIHFTGSAGQSFGAFVPAGIEMRLEGDANDYVGKGLSGGRLIVHPHVSAPLVAEENVIAGNVIGYGATSGEIFIRGLVGERFCVRNSGATAVVEGVGDHGCEYMTGGRVVVLGPTGRNFAAGMSGGIAYVYDPHGTFAAQVNYEMVDLEDLASDDVAWLQETVERHGALTQSAIADRIMRNWASEVKNFRKVMPRDYKKVLTVIEAARAEGLNESDTAQRIMEAARG